MGRAGIVIPFGTKSPGRHPQRLIMPRSRRTSTMDPKRRALLAAGAAVAATTAMPRVFARQPGSTATGKFYDKGSVRIYYEEAGAGFPLLLLPGGGLNATIS